MAINNMFDPLQYGATPVASVKTNKKFNPLDYGAVPVQPTQKEQKPFTFDVAPVAQTPEIKKQRLLQAQATADKAKKESDYANSWGGLAMNTIKGVGETLASSEIGLGKTIAKTFGNQMNTYVDSINSLTKIQSDTYRMIKDKEKQGQNTDNLKRAYNANVKQLEELKAGLDEETNLPTTGQALGQIGGTSLDLLSMGTYGTAAKGMKARELAIKTKPLLQSVVTQKSTGLLNKPAVVRVATGTGIGYGYDVSQGLQGNRGEDRTGFNSLIPGAGTLIGGIIPASLEYNQFLKTKAPQEIINSRIQTLTDIENQYVKLRKNANYSKDANLGSKQRISSVDIGLPQAVDESGTLRTIGKGGVAERYENQFIPKTEGIGRQILEKEGASISPEILTKKLKANIESNFLIRGKAKTAALNNIDSEVAAYARNSDGTIPLTELHDAKIATTKGIKDFATPAEIKTYQKSLANGLKTAIEDTSKARFDVGGKKIGIIEVNAELSKRLKDIKFIESLDGKKVKGGKMGKYFATIAGNVVGAAVGSIAGPFGSGIGSVIGGELGSKIKGTQMMNTFAGNIGKIGQESSVITGAKKYINTPKPPLLGLPEPKVGSPRSSIGSGQTINLPAKGQGILESARLAKIQKQTQANANAYSNNLGNRQEIYQPITSKNNITNIIPEKVNKPTSTLPQNTSNINELSTTGGNGAPFTNSMSGTSRTGVVKSGNQAIQAQLSENALIKEAKKYKSADNFYELMGSKNLNELKNKGIRGKEQIIKYWEKATGKKSIPDYGMSHRPSETGATAANVTQEVSESGLPKDFYQHPEYYADMSSKSYQESFNVLKKIKDKPNADVTIYRASPKNELNIGDWVTLSKNYAKGESLTENSPVNSFKVKAKDIQFAGDDINEFGYYPKSQLTDIWNRANKK